MASGRLAGVMRRLVDVALADGGGLSDGALLERYLNLREEAAFAALVRIHGPMVLGVCRRVLGNVHDADDAFQATFLVLVRKGQSIVPRERVGPWLYGVAYRTALKASAMAKRRRGKQVKLEDVPGKTAQPEAEWLALLDQEISRLPEKYRAPLVLCDLESKTRKQAAKLLGCPEGTVATRLQHARGLIHKRLARHGLPAAAGATALALGQAASAKVPFALLKATVKHASLFAAGTSAGAIPLKIIVLMEGVLNAMVLTKIKTATALLVLTGVLGVGGFAGKVYVAADDAPLPPPVTNPLSPPLTKGGPGGVVQQAAVANAKAEDALPLPTGPAPAQAYVSLHESRLIMRMRSMGYRAMTTRDASGRPTTSYAPFETQIKRSVTRDDLKMVLEVQRSGQRILDSSEWPKAIKGETLALVVEDKGDFDLAHLRLIKEGTLVFVLAHKEFVVPPIPKAPIEAQVVPAQLVPAPSSVPDVVEPLPAPPPSPAKVGPPPPLEGRKSTKLPVDWLKSLLPDRYDFGTAEQGKLLRHSIALVNENAKMEITNVRVSCGCLSAEVSKKVIPPGQGATLELVLDTRRFSGHKRMSVFVNVIADGKPYEFHTIVTATSARPEDLPKPVVGSAPGPIQGSPVNPPSPFSNAAPPDNLSQFNAQTMQQANRDLAALKFYVKTGHGVSAAFYRDLIERRYPDTLYSQQASKLIGKMPPPGPPRKAATIIGQIIIVGNKYLPDALIRKGLGFYPGQPFEGNALSPTMEGLGDVGIKLWVTWEVSNNPGDYKDIVVTVHEELSEAMRADFNKLQGAWIVTSTSLQGKAESNFVKEVGFQGNAMTTKNSKTETRGLFLLSPPSEPKRMRIFPIDGPADAQGPGFKYEFKGEQLKLWFPIEFNPGSPINDRYVELILKRKQPGETLQPAPARKAATRIGTIIIVGNDYLPDTVIRKALDIYPPQIVEEKDLHAAEERANRLNEGGIRLAATVHVLDAGKSGEFRDIRVDVRELLSSATRADFNKLQGAWTVVSASFQGKADRDLADADFVFKGAELTATNKDTLKEQLQKERFKFLLNPSAQPKEIRLYPLDGTSDPARGTYELKGDVLLLRVRVDRDTGPATASTQMMEMTLKRKRSPGS